MNKALAQITDTLTNLSTGWFDVVVLAVLAFGIFKGRKRGISGELLDVFKWLLVVVACGGLYEPLGRIFASYSHVGLLTAYVSTYLLLAIFIHLMFAWLKIVVGEKLVSSDIFGSMEYYLGMGAGTLRFACMLVVGLALLNAKYISEADLKAQARMQQDNFGDISFPTLGSIQQDVFKESFVGNLVKTHLPGQLIDSTSGGQSSAKNEHIGKRRENEVNEAMNTKPKT
jgi:uncharacterized membrane protein required for colicin V production